MILVKDNVEKLVPDKDTAMIRKLKELGYKEEKKAAGDTGEVQKTAERKDLKVDALRQIAKENGIEGTSALTKEELKEVLTEKGLI